MIRLKHPKLTVLAALFTIFGFGLTLAPRANAVSSFQAGRIIDDVIMADYKSMTVSQIQSFLNSKVPKCDTNGVKQSEYGGGTRAQYGTSHGYPPPYTCLKDYTQGGKSSAQIIYNVAQVYKISPEVLIVLLQKEQGLVTDEWPWSIQYRSATGYGCPDGGACDDDYYGFANQVNNAAKMYRKILDRDEDWYVRYTVDNNYIQYNPNPDCGGSYVNVQNWATAALYNYTPYQPNKKALDAGYGSGDSCSSYGNRNFWLYFNDWFGSPIGGPVFIECDGQHYMYENGWNRKRLLTTDGKAAWGAEDLTFITDSPLCSLPAYDLAAGKLARSRNTDKLYLIDSGQYFYIYNQDISDAWGLGNIKDTVPFFDSKTLKIMLTSGGNLPNVATSTNPDRYDIYVIDNQKRYTISGTPEMDGTNLKLIRGKLGYFTKTPEMSVNLLASLENTGSIDYSFTSASNRYLFDFGKIRRIDTSSLPNWGNIPDGPDLSSDFVHLTGGYTALGDSFKNGNYYFTFDGTTTILKIADPVDSLLAKSTDISGELLSKISEQYTINTVSLIGEDESIRLVRCDSDKFLIERSIPKKRKLSAEALAEWGFDEYYFVSGDKACGYPQYDLTLDRLVRSRNTHNVYYIDNGTAYLADSQEAADVYDIGDIDTIIVPQYNGGSIHFLRVVKYLPPDL